MSEDLLVERPAIQPAGGLLDRSSGGETRFPLEGTFPDDENSPVLFPEGGNVLFVVTTVCCDLLVPECPTCLRPFEKVTVVTVPEATVHEDHCLAAREHKIGLSRQHPYMEAITKTESVQP